MKFSEQSRAGIVNINDSSTYWELHIPFGGGSGTESGRGRIGGIHTLVEMTEIKTITFSI
jgi:succinate-semialdehyde dehydrogenase/glutarate-semialdehyde dehydrogenase